MNFEALLQDYGYYGILIGTFLEGETILILGGVAAQFGFLDLTMVILSAFVGSSAGDQLYYFIGRWKGRTLLDMFPRWQPSADKVMYHIEKHQNLIMLTFRFFYGLRNATPFVLGITKVSTPRFVVLNLIGAAVWACSFALCGYLLGDAHERVMGKGYGLVLLGVLTLLFSGFWLIRRWTLARRAEKKKDQPADTVS
jgi:membrane protein DedA with SNARE-associated domain